jgi:hypothetical protein
MAAFIGRPFAVERKTAQPARARGGFRVDVSMVRKIISSV